VRNCVYTAAPCGNPSQSYRASPATWDHTVLSATQQRWMSLITAFSQSDWYSTYLCLKNATFAVGYIMRWFTCPQTATHRSSNDSIVTQLRVKLMTFWSQTITPSNQLYWQAAVQHTDYSASLRFVSSNDRNIQVYSKHSSVLNIVISAKLLKLWYKIN